MSFLFMLGAIGGFYIMNRGKGIDKPFGLCLGGLCWFISGIFDTEHPINIGIGLSILIIGIIWFNTYMSKEGRKTLPPNEDVLKTPYTSDHTMSQNQPRVNFDPSFKAPQPKIEDSPTHIKLPDTDLLITETPAQNNQTIEPKQIFINKESNKSEKSVEDNRRKRIQRRKNQVLNTPENIIQLIASSHWKFTKISFDKTNSKYIYKYTDKDGISIHGTVNRKSIRIKFIFPNETLDFNTRLCDQLHKALLSSEEQTLVADWQKEKETLYQKEKTKKTAVAKNHISTKCYSPADLSNYSNSDSNNRSSCIYCGTSTVIGNVCDSCRCRYSKKRRGIGGYPSYDPRARGNNFLKADVPSKKKNY